MINIIAAHDKNRVIGNKGKIPWNIPEDLHRFKEITTGGIVIFGRRTYEEIGRPLPGRVNIVLSKNPSYNAKGCICAQSLSEAISICQSDEILQKKDIFICGGERIYREAIKISDKLYITVVDAEFEGDCYFPKYDTEDYILVKKERFKSEIQCTFYEYLKKIF